MNEKPVKKCITAVEKFTLSYRGSNRSLRICSAVMSKSLKRSSVAASVFFHENWLIIPARLGFMYDVRLAALPQLVTKQTYVLSIWAVRAHSS